MWRTLSSSKGNVGFLWQRCSVKGPPHVCRGEFHSLPQVVAGSVGFLSSRDGDLMELLRVPMGSQEYCGVGMVLSGLHWVWCNGRGPHLELRQEPQGSSAVLTWVSGCVCHFRQGAGLDMCGCMELCFPLELSKGFQASSRVEFGTWGSFWISNRGIRTPFVL